MELGNEFQERVFEATEFFQTVQVASIDPTYCIMHLGNKLKIAVGVEDTDTCIILTTILPHSIITPPYEDGPAEKCFT